MQPLLGSHLSIAGGLENALIEAKRLRMGCVQIFTANQRQWRAAPLDDARIAAWAGWLDDLGWSGGAGPQRVVSHGSYLLNLASPDSAQWRRSVDRLRQELERCELLGIGRCVIHPGAHMNGRPGPPPGGGMTRSQLAGLRRIARGLDRVHRELPGFRVMTCLETTAGSGSNLGYDFEHLAWVRDNVRAPERVAFCFDTAHVTAAGYDMCTDGAAAEVLDRWAATCGLENLLAVHVNDSAAPRGSRRDRHAHIGDGCCGSSCFRAVLNHPMFADVPKLLETPKGSTPRGTPWDIVNLRRLKRLANPLDPSR